MKLQKLTAAAAGFMVLQLVLVLVGVGPHGGACQGMFWLLLAGFTLGDFLARTIDRVPRRYRWLAAGFSIAALIPMLLLAADHPEPALQKPALAVALAGLPVPILVSQLVIEREIRDQTNSPALLLGVSLLEALFAMEVLSSMSLVIFPFSVLYLYMILKSILTALILISFMRIRA